MKRTFKSCPTCKPMNPADRERMHKLMEQRMKMIEVKRNPPKKTLLEKVLGLFRL